MATRNRRLPRPQGVGRNVPRLPPASDVDPPLVDEAVAAIEQVCRLTRLSPWPVWKDWVGMLEAALRLQADNARAVALTGRFIEDPPEVAAHFQKARTRYLRAADQYPGAYRAMQAAFARVSALLALAAEPGLAEYGGQADLNPDVIGRIFVRLLEPGPVWRQYFPPWRTALAAAESRLPDRAAVQAAVIETVVDAGSRLARRHPDSPRLVPGENWAEYLAAVEPYLAPIVIGPELIGSSAGMLALAARFPAWAVQSGLVQFVWPEADADPLLQQMAGINIRLYGLNGCRLELARAAAEIQQVLAQEPAAPSPPLVLPPAYAGPDSASEPDRRDRPTFQQRFQARKGGGSS